LLSSDGLLPDILYAADIKRAGLVFAGMMQAQRAIAVSNRPELEFVYDACVFASAHRTAPPYFLLDIPFFDCHDFGQNEKRGLPCHFK